MRRWAAVLVFPLIACSQGPSSPVAGATPSPMQSATPSPIASPTPVADLPLAKVDFSCRLPISISTGNPAALSTQAGFVSFPSGTVTIDPVGNGGTYFDRAFSRWLPVARDAVSPDGTHYAYVDLGDGVFNVHVVDVRTGKDHVLRENASGFSFQPFVLDYASEGIYIGQAFERVQPGLWLVAPTTGAIRQVSKVAGLQVSAGHGVFWSGEINPADHNPIRVPSSAGTLADQIDRFDLKSGKQVVWLYQPGKGLTVVGLDIRGRPLITRYSGQAPVPPKTDPIDHPATELLIALDSTTQRSIYKGQLAELLGGAIGDAHGVWFGSPQGIYLYSEAHGLQKVFDQPSTPANGCF